MASGDYLQKPVVVNLASSPPMPPLPVAYASTPLPLHHTAMSPGTGAAGAIREAMVKQELGGHNLTPCRPHTAHKLLVGQPWPSGSGSGLEAGD